jgi:hypothetical protein
MPNQRPKIAVTTQTNLTPSCRDVVFKNVASQNV